MNKIISKILASRLAPILPKIISLNQSGFIKGRMITDNILLAQEMVEQIKTKRRGGNTILKLDMTKAYDRISWVFLISVMRKFGFGEVWLDMVWRLISNCHFSVIINGKSHGFFKSSRGLRQDDPISPALFIIGAEVMSRKLNHLRYVTDFTPFSCPATCEPITHLAYADDVLIFSAADKKSLKAVKRIIQEYEKVSGQQVNASKSGFLVDKKAPKEMISRIRHCTGFTRKKFPTMYLGCPLFQGRKTKLIFSNLVDKIEAKMKGWSCKLLSSGGRITLIKSVLLSIPTHQLAALDPPKGLLSDIEKKLANFLWGQTGTGQKHH